MSPTTVCFFNLQIKLLVCKKKKNICDSFQFHSNKRQGLSLNKSRFGLKRNEVGRLNDPFVSKLASEE